VWNDPLVIALFFVFIAEMGDKTQLVALAFATRYAAGTVLAGVFGATLVVHLFSVGLGEVLGLTIPVFWTNILAGLAFVAFGLWTLRGDELEDDHGSAEPRFGPLMTVAIAFFLAELGDKTMLTTVTIATQHNDFVGVWIGSTVGMVAADGIAISIGKVLGKKLPERAIRYGAAAIFLITGTLTLIAAGANRWLP
jgi:putative Ca2+/H+ antiporter (TMEM165/GDT1 family)